MAGMKVVPIKTALDGTIDMEDVKAKVVQHKDNLACLMITYPSTNGVFESTVSEICSLVHGAGGQVGPFQTSVTKSRIGLPGWGKHERPSRSLPPRRLR